MRRIAFLVALGAIGVGQVHASITIVSINRGVTVDGVSSTNNTLGVFDTALSNTTAGGIAEASLRSNVGSNIFTADGLSSEFATVFDQSFDIRARTFFNVTFDLSGIYEFELLGALGGHSEDEHWVTTVSLKGPSIDYSEGGSTIFYRPIAEQGQLGPGTYAFSLNAFPVVYMVPGESNDFAVSGFGGELLGTGSPASFFSLSLSPAVPEPSTFVVWSMLGLTSTHLLRRRRDN